MAIKNPIAYLRRRNYPEIFARVDRKPNFLDLMPYLLYSFYRGSDYRKGLLRSFRVNRIPLCSVAEKPLYPLPVIELIINSTLKDFTNLSEVIISYLKKV